MTIRRLNLRRGRPGGIEALRATLSVNAMRQCKANEDQQKKAADTFGVSHSAKLQAQIDPTAAFKSATDADPESRKRA